MKGFSITMFIQAPKDLTRIQSKLLFGLTRRQLTCFGIAALIGVPAYFLTKGALGNSATLLLMIFLMLPLFLLGMYQKDGMPAEILLKNFVHSTFARPSKRHYRTENLYDYLRKEGDAYKLEEQTRQINRRGKPEKALAGASKRNPRRNLPQKGAKRPK
ncbi:MAG: PrgI family protein [Clostridiales bacterium]|jgi:hypothetical protein|nr:PrgI family protein [Clostridiales bacterium]